MALISRSRFGDLLRHHRLKAKLTQAALADQASMSARGISDLERGINESPQRKTAVALADALKLTADDREQFIEAGQRAPALAAASHKGQAPVSAVRPGPLKLIGRGCEQTKIERLLAGVGTPMLIFSGEPGIGKTRLLLEATERAQQAGWAVLSGGSHQSDGQHPYAPLVQALEGYLAGQALPRWRQQLKGCEWMARLLPELMDVIPAPAPSWRLPPEQERRLMFAAVGRFVERIADPVGVLLVLDDLQWATPDGLSLLASLLRSAATSGRPNSLRVVAASRDTHFDASHPLPPFILDLTHDNLVSVTRLSPLEMEQADVLLHAALADGEVVSEDEREALIRKVVARSGGVPLFLMSFAREVRASQIAGNHSLAAADIPWDVAELIHHRINGLPGAARDVLAVAAVYGREAPVSLLVNASELTERQVVEAIEAATAARLLIETDDAACMFAHELFRETALADLSAARNRMLHHQIARALEADPLLAQTGPLAFHYGRSADTDKAIVYLERAGDQALALRAYAAAETCYRDALGYLASPGSSGARGRLWEKLGSLLMGWGKYDGAIEAFEEAVASFDRAGDRDGAGRAVAQIGWAHVRGGIGKQGLSRVESLLAPEMMADVILPTQVALLCAHAVLLFALNRYDEQLASARQASALARETGDTQSLAQSMRLEGLALVLLGRFDEALPVVLETVWLAERAGDLDSFSAALNDTAAVYRVRGELISSWAYSARSVEVAEQLGDPTGVAFFATSHGDNAFLLGDWVEARQHFERAVAVARQIGSSWVTAYTLLFLGQLNLAEGRSEEAARLLDEALVCAERDHDLQALRGVQAILVERDLICGDAASALQRLQPLQPLTTIGEKDGIALLPLLGWAQLSLGDFLGATESLNQCMRRAKETGNRLVIVDALLAQARLSIRQASWQPAEQALDDALACSQAMAYPYAKAKARFIYGQLCAARGACAQARDQYEQALVICRRLGEKLYQEHIERALAQLTEA